MKSYTKASTIQRRKPGNAVHGGKGKISEQLENDYGKLKYISVFMQKIA